MGEGLQLAICPSFTGPTSLQALDVSGRSNNGTLNNMDRNTAWQTSGGRGSLFFDPSLGWQHVQTSAPRTTGNSFTISCWANCRLAGTLQVAWWREGHSYLYSLGAGGFVLNYGATSSNEFGVTGAIIGRWAHICMTYDGLTGRGYVDGVLGGSRSNAAIISHTSGVSLSTRSGSAAWASATSNDDFRLYDRALTAPEIRQLYERDRGGGMLYQPPKRRSVFIAAGFRAYWHRRQSQLIGGGL